MAGQCGDIPGRSQQVNPHSLNRHGSSFNSDLYRASGGTENFGEVRVDFGDLYDCTSPSLPLPPQMILFTTDEEILSRVGHHDDYFQTYGDSRHIEDNNEVCLEVGTEGEGGGEEEREGGGEGGHTELY